MGVKRNGTILDAVVAVLKAEGRPLSLPEMYALVVEKGLFQFGAKEPLGMVRATVRKHLRAHGAVGQPAARLAQVDSEKYSAI